MKTLWVKLIKLMFWFQFKHDIYSKLSSVVAHYRDGIYIKNNPVDHAGVSSFEQLTATLKLVEWSEDRWWGFADTIAAPERIQYVVDTGNQFKSDTDCDDSSIYAASILNYHSKIKGRDKPNFGNVTILNSYLMSVIYMHGWAQRGHNVCVFTYLDEKGYYRYGCISNWHGCKPQLDMGSLHDVVDYVCGTDDFVTAQLLTVYKTGDPGYRVATKSYMLLDEYSGAWKSRFAA